MCQLKSRGADTQRIIRYSVRTEKNLVHESRSRRAISLSSSRSQEGNPNVFSVDLRLAGVVKCPDMRLRCVPHMHIRTYIHHERTMLNLYTTTKTSFRFRGCSENLARVSRLPSSRRRGLDLNAMPWISMTRRIKNNPILPRLEKTLQESAPNFASDFVW